MLVTTFLEWRTVAREPGKREKDDDEAMERVVCMVSGGFWYFVDVSVPGDWE